MADFSALKTAIQTYIKQNGNEEITGEILQEILLSVVTTLGDSAINNLVTALANEVAARQNADGTLQQNITNEATARGYADTALSNRLGSTITAEHPAAEQIGEEAEAREAADTALQGLIDRITDNIENGYVYAGIATPSSTPATGKVFYLALTAGTYTNFGSTEVTQGINILKYNGSAWSLDAFIGIDDTPTPNSQKLVKSGGVFDKVMTDGSAFDISAYFASGGTLATYANLDAALAALNTLSADYKKGGMSIKFVQSSDNNYIRYNLISNEFTTDVSKWAIDDVGVYIENPEYIEAITDNEGKLILAIKIDGDIHYFCGIPTQIQKALRTKVDKEDGKALIQTEVSENIGFTRDSEYLFVETDSDGKILGGRKRDGIKIENIGLILSGTIIKNIADIERRKELKLDNENKIISYIKENGKLVVCAGIETPNIRVDNITLSDEGKERLRNDLDIQGGGTGILDFNPSSEVVPKISNLNRRYISMGGSTTEYPPVLTLLHFSDIHGNNENILRIKDFYDEYSSYIDDVLDTGDTISLSWSQGLPSAIASVPKYLRIIGNHDTMERVGTPPNHHWELIGGLDCYNTNLKDYIGEWDVVQPNDAATEGYNYYYKDYTEQNVRLICLDGEHWDITELSWFQNILADAKTSGLHVVVAVHRSPFLVNPIQGNTFDSVDWPNIYSGAVMTLSGAIDAVNDFISEENGVTGNFVCWLTGHSHQDGMGLGQGNASNQLQISIATASVSTSFNYGEIERIDGTKSQDCFNIIGIETHTKTITLMRVGAQYDRHMRRRNTLCWNYGSNSLVYCD